MNKPWLVKILHAVSFLGAPPKCLFCGKEEVSRKMPFCDGCQVYFTKKLSQGCPLCGDTSRKCKCISVTTINSVVYLFLYGSKQLRHLMYHLKRNANRYEAQFLARFLCARIRERHGTKLPFDCITFVPRNKKDKRYYGYDHAELLAQYVALELNLPCLPFVKHSGEGGEQKRLSREERAFAAKKRFALNTKQLANGVLPYKRVLLIDDISTTGATAEVCSRIMKGAGVDSVHLAVIALAGYAAD